MRPGTWRVLDTAWVLRRVREGTRIRNIICDCSVCRGGRLRRIVNYKWCRQCIAPVSSWGRGRAKLHRFDRLRCFVTWLLNNKGEASVVHCWRQWCTSILRHFCRGGEVPTRYAKEFVAVAVGMLTAANMVVLGTYGSFRAAKPVKLILAFPVRTSNY